MIIEIKFGIRWPYINKFANIQGKQRDFKIQSCACEHDSSPSGLMDKIFFFFHLALQSQLGLG
jgi:hypothetical protein